MAQRPATATHAWYYDHDDGTHARGDDILDRYPDADTLAELVHDGRIERVSDSVTDDPLAVVVDFAAKELDAHTRENGTANQYDGIDGVRRLADVEFALRRVRNGRTGTLTPRIIDDVGAILEADSAVTTHDRENVLWTLGAALDRANNPIETVEAALDDTGVPRSTRRVVLTELERR